MVLVSPSDPWKFQRFGLMFENYLKPSQHVSFSYHSSQVPLFIAPRSRSKLVQERRDGGKVLAVRDEFPLERDAGFSAKWSFEPGAKHLLALRAVLDANLHRLVAGR